MHTLPDALKAAIYFAASTAITWWFIVAGTGQYGDSRRLMLLSCAIAGGKWALQIVAALFFLHTPQRWAFLRRIGWVCLAGSLMLLPLCIAPVQLARHGFLPLLLSSVLLMIALYYRAVRRSGLSPRWFWGWVACLAAAITLQLTVVFQVW